MLFASWEVHTVKNCARSLVLGPITSKVCNMIDCEIIKIDKVILSRETTHMEKLQDGLAPTGDSSGTAGTLILKSC